VEAFNMRFFPIAAAAPLLFVVTTACGEDAATGPGGVSGSSSSPIGGQVGTSGNAGAGGSAVANGGAGTAGSSAGAATGGALTAGANPGGAAGLGGASGGSSGGAGTAGRGGSAGASGSPGASGSGGAATTEKFSFFVTSLAAVRRESNSQDGFGGDLGGLAGADAICTRIAEKSMAGAGAKGWRAFLSTSTVNAVDRVGTGPWYDRAGRLFAQNVQGLLTERPTGDAAITADLPNEDGVPNRAGTGGGNDDNHDVITGTNLMGKWDGGPTCGDWTSKTGGDGPRVGHSWPAQSGRSWMQAHTAPGCEPSVSLVQNGPGSGNGIGNGGGYGGFYCFALKP
jgi:hypothetical protein